MDLKGLGIGIGKDAISGAVSALNTATKMALNTLYPNEFEVYMVTLELVDKDDNLLDYFTFPINPESISKSQPYVKQIDRSYGAVVVNKTGKFAPQDITIKGNFGRQFKFVTRDKSIKNVSWSGLLPWTKDDDSNLEFNRYYKSGYGCFKIVQNICKKADELDDGYARKLYFHNLALGESYLVEVLNFQGSQSSSSNMLWNYDLRMKIISNVFDKNPVKTLGERLVTSVVTMGANETTKSANKLYSSLMRSI